MSARSHTLLTAVQLGSILQAARKAQGLTQSALAARIGLRVGRWTIPARGEIELRYDADWVGLDAGRPLSLSLPFNLQNLPLRGERVTNYFDNLLPDSDAAHKPYFQAPDGTGGRTAGGLQHLGGQ